MNSLAKKVVTVAARSSKLSQAQVVEVLGEMLPFCPNLEFSTTAILSHGDVDLKTSLRHLEKTDFFTREIDACVLSGLCDIAIHSAKDLPDPMDEKLIIVALTKGVDSSDVLIMKPGFTFNTLQRGARIGTSSIRREETIRQLRPDFMIADIRGSVDERLSQLQKGDYDAIVMAKAAVIRMGWKDLNLFTLPGEVAPWQGRLAIVALKSNQEMAQLFSSIDSRLCASSI